MTVDPAFSKYIIIVMGSSASGITRFINCISELPPQTVPDPNPSHTLKPLDYGRLTIDDSNVIYLYGLSNENPLSAWTFLFDREDPIGVITLVDSTHPETLSISKSLINNIDGDIPFIIAANKQDKKGAWELDAIRVALNLHSTIPVMGCSAKTGVGVREVVLTILDILLMPDEDEWDDDNTLDSDDDEWDEDETEEHHWEDYLIHDNNDGETEKIESTTLAQTNTPSLIDLTI